jgi:hypothetical protein
VTDGGRNYTLLIGSDDIAYLSYLAESNSQYFIPKVLKLDGNNWVEAGTGLNFTANSMNMALDENNVPHIAVAVLTASDGAVYKLVNGAWVEQGSPSFTIWDGPKKPGMTFDGSDLYLSHISDTGDGLSVRKWDGNNWTLVGSENFVSAAQRSTVAIISGGEIYVAYENDPNCDPMMGSCMEYQSKVSHWDGANWVEMISFDAGGMGFSTESTLLKKDANNNLLLLGYTGFGAKPSVMKYDGTTWTAVVTSPYQGQGASGHVFAVHSDNTLYTVFGDGSLNNNPSVKTIGLGGLAVVAAAQTISSTENDSIVMTLTATDIDGDLLSYSISGGEDQAAFSMGSSSGVLSFVTAPDYENPTDQGEGIGNNTYVVEITADDSNGGLGTTTVTVTVTDQDEPPVLGVVPSQVTTEDFANLLISMETAGTVPDRLNFDASIDDSTLGVVSMIGATVVIALQPNQSGNAIITVTATGSAGSDTTTFALSVEPANDAPIFSAAPPSIGTTFVHFGTPGFGELDGNPFITLAASGISMDLDSTGTPYVAYGIMETADSMMNRSIYVRRWDGNAWVGIGSSQPVTDDGEEFILKIGSNNTPYLAYLARENSATANIPEVLKFDGTNWVRAGTGLNFYSNIIQLARDENGSIYLAAYITAQNVEAVFHLVNGVWTAQGSPTFRLTSTFPGLVVENSNIYLSGITDTSGSDAWLSVRKYNGTTWSLVGPGQLVNFSRKSSLVVKSNNDLFLAVEVPEVPSCPMFNCTTYVSRVYEWDSSDWVKIGEFSPSPGGVSMRDTLLKKDVNEDLLLSFSGGINAALPSVMRYDGTTWSAILTSPYQSQSAALHRFEVDSDNNLYTAFLDGLRFNNPTVKTIGLGGPADPPLDQTTSVFEGTSIVMTLMATDIEGDSIAYSVSGGADQVAFEVSESSGVLSFTTPPEFDNPTDLGDIAGNNTYVVKVTADDSNGGLTVATVTVTVLEGPSLPALSTVPLQRTTEDFPGLFLSLEFSGSTTGTVFASIDNPNLAGVFVFEGPDQNNILNISPFADQYGSATVTLTSTNEGGTSITTFALIIDPANDAPRFELNSGWQLAGTRGFAGGTGYSTSMDFDSSGVPYLGFHDVGNLNKASVMKYDGTTWNVLGGLGFSNGSAYYPSLVIDSGDVPYLGFSDDDELGKATVMKFDGENWVAVGGTGFTGDAVGYTSLALDSSDTPYLAFRASGPPNKVSVMKYDGDDWVLLGSADFSNAAVQPLSLKFDSTDTPYLAFNGDGSKVTVMKFDSLTSDWQEVGTNDISDPGSAWASLVFDSLDTPYVAYSDGGNSSSPTVMKLNSVSDLWEPVGSQGFSGAFASHIAFDISPLDVLYLAHVDWSFSGLGKLSAWKFDGGGWALMGKQGFTASQGQHTSLKVDPDGNPYIAFADSGSSLKITAMNFTLGDKAPSVLEGTSEAVTIRATDVEGDSISFLVSGGADEGTFTIDSDSGLLSFKIAPDFDNPTDLGDTAGNNTYVVEVSADDGNGGISTVPITITVTDAPEPPTLSIIPAQETTEDFDLFSVNLGLNGVTFLAEIDDSTLATLEVSGNSLLITPLPNQSGNATITLTASNSLGSDTTSFALTINPANDLPQFSNPRTNIWQATGDGLSDGTAAQISLGFNSQNTPYIVFEDAGNAQGATLLRRVGGKWEGVGEKNFTGGYGLYLPLDFGPGDIPYVGFLENFNSNKATVMKFESSAWSVVGTRGFSPDNSFYFDMALDSTGTPYVVFKDGSKNKGSVMKFDGTDWVFVGTQGFTAGSVIGTSIAIDANDVLYIGFRDGGNQSKASVMTFDGTDWVFVGSPGFSDGISNSVVVELDHENTPYISLSDFAADGKITVMKFDGTDWVAVGAKTFSDGKMAFQSLAFDSKNTPWVAYQEFGTTKKATIMKFNGTDWVAFGEKSFTASSASYTSLTFDSNDVPFLAYQDGTNSNKLTVQGFVPGPINVSLIEGQSLALTLTATDIDGDSLSFSTAGGDDQAVFSIDSDTGEISFKETSDFENPTDQDGDNIYQLLVKVSDPDAAMDTASVEITVLDTNEAPLITSSGGGSEATATLKENGTIVLTVAGSDEEGDSLTYSISGGDDSDFLSIDPTTGELTFVNSPDFENPLDSNGDNSFIVEITVTSEGGTATQTLVITLENSNDNSPSLESASFTIPETLTLSSDAGTPVTGSDLDGDLLSYSILEGDSLGHFTISSTSAQITVASTLDFETTTSYLLVVQADDGSHLVTAPITILLTNANDNSPQVTGNSFSVLENRDQGTLVGVPIQATDLDGDELSFSILDGNIDDAFTVDSSSGQISVAGGLDFETLNQYLLSVEVSDGELSDTTSVIIQISDLDDTPPRITAVEIPSANSYRAGETLVFTLKLNEDVVVDTSSGSPRLTLIIGDKTVFAVFIENKGGRDLIFQYGVENGDLDENGIELGSKLSLNEASIQDEAGNNLDLDIPSKDTSSITIDALAPQTPPAPISSASEKTSDPRPSISGRAEPGSTVILKQDGKIIAEIPVDSDGKWNFKPEEDLEPGPHSFTITSKDSNENESEQSEPLDFEVVPEVPPSPLEILNALIDEQDTPSITLEHLENVDVVGITPANLESYQEALKKNGPANSENEVQDLIDEVDVQVACEALNIGEFVFPNVSMAEIRESFELPLEIDGVVLDWVSSDINTIDHLGAVTRPDGALGDGNIVLTVTLSKGTQSVTKTYDLRVIKKPLKEQFGEVRSEDEGDGEKVSVPLSDEFSEITTSTIDFDSTKPTIEATSGEVCLEANALIPGGNVHVQICHESDGDLEIKYEGAKESDTTSNLVKADTPEYDAKLNEDGDFEIEVPIDGDLEEDKTIKVKLEPDGTVIGEVKYKDEQGEDESAKIVSELDNTDVEITDDGELILTGSTINSEGETVTVIAKVTDSGTSLTGVQTPDGTSTVLVTLPGVDTVIKENGEVTSSLNTPNEEGSLDITATTTNSGWINLVQKQFDENGELISEELKQFQPGSKITVTGRALVRSETKIEGTDKGSVTVTDDQGNEIETKLEAEIPAQIRETEDGSIEAAATGKDSQGGDVELIVTAKVDGRTEHSVKVGSKETKATSEIEGAETKIKSDGVETAVEVKSTPTSNAVSLVVSADNDGKSEHLLVLKDAAGNETSRIKAKSEIPGTKTTIKQDKNGKAFIETSVSVLGTQDEKLDIKVSGNVDGEAAHEIELTNESGEKFVTKANFKIPGASTNISSEGSVETTAALGTGSGQKLIKVYANPNGTATHSINFKDSSGKTINTSAVSEVKGAETEISPSGVVSTKAVPKSGISSAGFFIRAVVQTRPDGESITFFEKVDSITQKILQVFRTNASSTPFEPNNTAKIREVGNEPVLEVEAGVTRILLFE